MNKFIGRKGFTLLELLMVIIVVGVLAALALPQYTSFVEKARATEATNMIGAIKSGEGIKKLETGNYCTTLTSSGLGFFVPTGGTDTYYTYGVALVGTTGYNITAQRTSKQGTAATTGKYISLVYNDTTGGSTWGGDYTEVIPSQ